MNANEAITCIVELIKNNDSYRKLWQLMISTEIECQYDIIYKGKKYHSPSGKINIKEIATKSAENIIKGMCDDNDENIFNMVRLKFINQEIQSDTLC